MATMLLSHFFDVFFGIKKKSLYLHRFFDLFEFMSMVYTLQIRLRPPHFNASRTYTDDSLANLLARLQSLVHVYSLNGFEYIVLTENPTDPNRFDFRILLDLRINK